MTWHTKLHFSPIIAVLQQRSASPSLADINLWTVEREKYASTQKFKASSILDLQHYRSHSSKLLQDWFTNAHPTITTPVNTTQIWCVLKNLIFLLLTKVLWLGLFRFLFVRSFIWFINIVPIPLFNRKPFKKKPFNKIFEIIRSFSGITFN